MPTNQGLIIILFPFALQSRKEFSNTVLCTENYPFKSIIIIFFEESIKLEDQDVTLCLKEI